MDDKSIAGMGLAAYLASDPVKRLLGPSADYVGQRARDLIQKCDVNLGRVFNAAVKALGERINDTGTVSPRVLVRVLDEGMFSEDPLVADYLGGVLASSRTAHGRDDRGLAYVAEVRGMSAYQIRAHYLINTAMLRHGPGTIQANLSDFCQRHGITVAIREADFRDAMDFAEDEDATEIMNHIVLGLENRGLCGYSKDVVFSEVVAGHRIFWPTPYGFEFYSHAMGMRPPTSGSFFDLDPIPKLLGTEFDALTVELGRNHNIGR